MLAVAVAVVGKATARPRAALGCVVRLLLLHGDSLFSGFAGDMLKQASKRPYMVPIRLRKPLSNIAQVLGRDHVAVVFDGFRDEFVSDRVELRSVEIEVLSVDLSIVCEIEINFLVNRLDEEINELVFVDFIVCLLLFRHNVSKQTF